MATSVGAVFPVEGVVPPNNVFWVRAWSIPGRAMAALQRRTLPEDVLWNFDLVEMSLVVVAPQ
jgi:hypothetical protein